MGDNWAVVSTNSYDGVKRADYSGSNENSQSDLVARINANGYENLTLSFYYKRYQMDPGDYGQVLYTVNGQETILATYEGATNNGNDDMEWQQASFSLPDATDQADVDIVIRGYANSSSDKFKIDTLNVSGDEMAASPDTHAPTVQLTAPLEPVINPEQITLKAVDDVRLASVRVVVSNESGVVDECSESNVGLVETTLQCDVGGLTDGLYSAAFTATDTSGNESEPGLLEFTVDHTQPSLSIVVPKNGLVTKFGALHVTGTASDMFTDILKVDYSVERVSGIAGSVVGSVYDGTATGTEAWEFTALSLTTGFYRFTVTAYDEAGNQRSLAHDIQVDLVLPNMSLVNALKDDEIQAHNFAVAAQAKDSDSGVTRVSADVFSGTQLLSHVKSCHDETMSATVVLKDVSCSIDVSQLGGGNYTIRFLAEDAAGNQSNPLFWKFRILTGTIVVTPSIPVANGDTGSASGGAVTRQTTNTIVAPRSTVVRASSTPTRLQDARTSKKETPPIQELLQKGSRDVLAASSQGLDEGCKQLLGVCLRNSLPIVVGATLIAGVAVVVLRQRGG